MLRFYLISAWRNLKKNKLISFINILGLAIGLSCAVLAIIYSYNELTYETYHTKVDRIQQVFTLGKFGSIEKVPYTFGPVPKELQATYPEIEAAARLRLINGIALLDNTPILEEEILVADTAVFSILRFDFVEGAPPGGPNTIVMNEQMSRKYFNAKSPLGERITMKLNGEKMDFMVTGVYRDLPSNTLIKASFVIPLSIAERLEWRAEEYTGTNFHGVVLTHPGTDIKALNNKIVSSFEMPVDIEGIKVGLIPLKRVHLHENIEENSKTNLWMLLVGGLVALLVSCFNYINLNTILFSTRLREVGIKKTYGAGQFSIFTQFITETFLASAVGFLIAVVIINLALPSFNELFGTELELNMQPVVAGIILVTFLLTVLISGSFPALALSGAKNLSMIINDGGQRKGRKPMMNLLITLQLLVAIMLLQFFILSWKQGNYMGRTDIVGFNGQDVICLSGNEWGDLNSVKQELLKNPAIKTVSWADKVPQVGVSMTNSWKEEGNQDLAIISFCEDDYLDLFEIGLTKGRFFTPEFSASDSNNVVINSLAVSALSLDDPIGSRMLVDDELFTIIGVVDDFQVVPPIFEDLPLIIAKAKEKQEFLLVRVAPDQRPEAHAHIREVLQTANHEYPVDIRYYYDLTADMARTYYATAIMLNVFTAIIIFNAMMGLFGLSFFVAQRKNKEVGIRKVFGATVSEILWKLSKSFIWRLLIAFFIASPLIYVIGTSYVQFFTNHISIGPDIFLTGGVLALLMLLIAAGWKIYMAAVANPVSTLKYE